MEDFFLTGYNTFKIKWTWILNFQIYIGINFIMNIYCCSSSYSISSITSKYIIPLYWLDKICINFFLLLEFFVEIEWKVLSTITQMTQKSCDIKFFTFTNCNLIFFCGEAILIRIICIYGCLYKDVWRCILLK